MPDWNAELYLQFAGERDKPIFDLISHIPLNDPKRILDIGCGPGNSTAHLKKRYKNAEIIGIDSSRSMIEKARQAHSGITWLLKDANEDLSDLGAFDIVFSNSVLHWLPGHDRLLPRLFDLLDIDGMIAVQIPYFMGTPVYEPFCGLVKSEKWDKRFPVKNPAYYHDIGYYYDIIGENPNAFSPADIWTTKHTHILNSKSDIIEWYSSTAFKPFLERLDIEELKNEFLNDIFIIIDGLYKPQKDGKYLFRFERLFFTARRKE
ncbi:MAG: methyltransferase domain-containing protein [Oscillospiraceae bacterium]|nr:methyltransferase domain-containing protein [Oscillospiraceae bacterium]